MSDVVTRYMTYPDVELPSDFPGEVQVTSLRDEPEGGPRTILVHVPAGGSIEPLSHIAPVQHIVLAGSYQIDGDIVEAGVYRLYPDHSNLPRIESKDGALILMVFDPIR